MNTSPLETLKTFDVQSLPDLDTVVLGALELFCTTPLPEVDSSHFKRPLVVGSGNAYRTGCIIYSDANAVFADESSYAHILETDPTIDGVVLISASGGKHAVEMAAFFSQKNLPVQLFTNNQNPPAAQYIGPDSIFAFPKNREPYTYNTSTYLGMILAKTKEDPTLVLEFIQSHLEGRLMQNFANYNAFTMIVPAQFEKVRSMFRTKFDELFGPYIVGRVFSDEEIKHAKTVVTSGDELFIGLGVENHSYGLSKNRLFVPLPPDAQYGSVLALGYYIIGQIQKQHPPYFKNAIGDYTKLASEIFKQEIKPIVE